MPKAGDPRTMRARAHRRESTRLQRDSVSHLWEARDAEDPEASMLLRRISALESELASLHLDLAGTDERPHYPASPFAPAHHAHRATA